MNELQIFKNDQFGQIRVITQDEEPWFVASDVCKILEISNPTDALKRLDEDERSRLNLGRQGDTNIVNEPGLYSLVLGSRKPEAKEFKRWLTHEVLPTLRKNGSYSIKPSNFKQQEAEARLRNSRVREAQTWLKIADRVNIPEYKHIMSAKAAETLAGTPILPLQETPAKTYTATEIGNILGVSASL